MYNEIHVGGAIAIGSGGLEFNEEEDNKDKNHDTLVNAFDITSNDKLNDIHSEVDPCSYEDVTKVTNIFKKWLAANGVKDDVIQRIFKI